MPKSSAPETQVTALDSLSFDLIFEKFEDFIVIIDPQGFDLLPDVGEVAFAALLIIIGPDEERPVSVPTSVI